MPKSITKKSPLDECRICGDYREHHKADGCQVCRNLGHIWDRPEADHQFEEKINAR